MENSVNEYNDEQIHYHTIVKKTRNVDQALIDTGLLDLLDLNDSRKVYDFIRSRYDYTDLPSALNDFFHEQRVKDYLQRLDYRRG